MYWAMIKIVVLQAEKQFSSLAHTSVIFEHWQFNLLLNQSQNHSYKLVWLNCIFYVNHIQYFEIINVTFNVSNMYVVR